MAQGVVTISFNVSGGPTGTRTYTQNVPLASAVDQTSVVALSSGANTITIPTGTSYMIITGPNAVSPTPNPLSAAVLTLKGVAGDTGVVISARNPHVHSFDTAPASVVLNASTTCTVEIAFL